MQAKTKGQGKAQNGNDGSWRACRTLRDFDAMPDGRQGYRPPFSEWIRHLAALPDGQAYAPAYIS